MLIVTAVTRFFGFLFCAAVLFLGVAERAAADSYPFEMRLSNNILGEKLFTGQITPENGRFEQTVSSGSLRVRLTGSIDGDAVSVTGELLFTGNWRFFPFSTEGAFASSGTFRGSVIAERSNGTPARGTIFITRPAPAVAAVAPALPVETLPAQPAAATAAARAQARTQAATQAQAAVVVPPAPPEPVLDHGQRADIQRQLRVLGLYASAIDGDVGPGARKAVASFQRANGLESTGYLTERTLALLATAAGARERELAAAQAAAEQRATEERAAQQLAEQRAAEERKTEQLAAEQRAAEERADEERAAQQVAAASQPPSPDLAAAVATLQPIDETFVAVKPANVRAAPQVTSDLVAALDVGERIDVLGRLPGEDWYVVARDGRPIGYVVRSQLAPEAIVASAQAAPAVPPELAALDYGRYHAVVIGNNAYRALPKLNTATTDAKAVAELLERDYGYSVTLLTDADEETILGAFAGLRRTLTADDNLLVYYAGHGQFDAEAERGYWLPVDAVADNRSSWISNADVTDMLKALKAKHVLVVADSCYSGTLTRGLAIGGKSPGYYHAIVERRARTVLTSGGLEPVLDAGGGAHSVFARAFLETLRGNAGVIDGEGVFQRVRELVILNAEQTPEYGNIRLAGHDGGDFLFVRQPR